MYMYTLLEFDCTQTSALRSYTTCVVRFGNSIYPRSCLQPVLACQASLNLKSVRRFRTCRSRALCFLWNHWIMLRPWIFRDMLYTPWKRFSGKHPLDDMQLNYTLHSAKATLLSFGPQLGSAVDADNRLQQGHHADPRKSLRLYGRDSVWGALRYQQTVL